MFLRAHLGSVSRIAGSQRQLLEENGSGVGAARLEGGPKVEVDADVSVVAITLVEGGALDHEDVEWHHHAVDGNQQ